MLLEKKDDKFMDEIKIFEEVVNIEDDMILLNGSIILLEKAILKTKNIKICVRTQEATNHNRPHVHVYYGEKSYLISIDSKCELLGNVKEDKFYRYLVKNFFSENNLQQYRKGWNEYSNSCMKFIKGDNGLYSSDYQKISR